MLCENIGFQNGSANITSELGKFLGHGAHIPVFCSINDMKSGRREEKLDASEEQETQKRLTEKQLNTQGLAGKRKSQE